MKSFKELLEQFEEQNAKLEEAYETLRALPSDASFALPSDAFSQLEDVCTPHTYGTVNLLAVRA